MWIDSHCHLEADDFRATDAATAAITDERPAVVARARQAGVDRLIVIGSGRGRTEIDNAIDWARREPDFFAAIGVHPHEASAMTDDLWHHIEVAATDSRVVAIGETGIDYHYNLSPPAVQRELMRRFLRLAKSLHKPVSLHIRSDDKRRSDDWDAHTHAQRIVREEWADAPAPGGVIHCFTGNADEARSWLDLGFHISLSGIVTFKTAEAIREAARIIPGDRLLLETDSPFLAPVPRRGKRNEPALLVHTAEQVAALRGVSLERLADETRGATERLFKLPARPAK